MRRSLSEIAQLVQSETAVLEKMGGSSAAPFGGAVDLDGSAIQTELMYMGKLRHEDDLVIGVGDADDVAYEQVQYPLTDLYRWLVGVIAAVEQAPGDEAAGQLVIQAVFLPGKSNLDTR